MNALPIQTIQSRIYFIRGHKVMTDKDLAEMYGVSTKAFNRAVKRNRFRFPGDFMFQLTRAEDRALRYQIGTSNNSEGRGGRRYRTFVFTEQGVSMLSSVLRSRRAALVNIAIMRAFVQLRQWLETHQDLSNKLHELEKKYDSQFKVVFDAIRELMTPPDEPALKRIRGFRQEG